MLPTAKTSSDLTYANAKVLLYGPPKVGKSTLCAGLDGDRTLFLACEPGLGGLEVFQVPVRSWEDFKNVYADLAKGDHGFQTIVVDTVDELFRFCQVATQAELGITHPSDLDYGKGWSAVGDKFRMGVGALANLGCGVWFISHAKTEEIKQRVGTINKQVPTVTGKAREFLLGFCDYIFFATVEETPEGEARVIHTAATEAYEAGSRLALPDPLPLNAVAVKAALSPQAKGSTDGGSSSGPRPVDAKREQQGRQPARA